MNTLGVSGGVTGLARLGLGCSRIASLSTRPGAGDIAVLLEIAYAEGVRFFDTADVYGQGDSERRLSKIAGRDGVVICTKAGLTIGGSQTAIRLVKPILRPILRFFRPAGSAAAAIRQTSQGTDFSHRRLERCLRGSLRRLNRTSVDVFLLHNAKAADLQNGSLYDLLDRFRAQGLAGVVGVSCNTLAEATQIADVGRVGALEVPLSVKTLPAAMALLDRARKDGLLIIAREVFGDGVNGAADIRAALAPLIEDPRISVVLTGTTSLGHLQENIAAVRSILNREGAGSCT